MLIVFYLLAIVAANLLVARFGADIIPLVSLVLVPFDLTSRDVLHERWEGPSLWRNMLVLIGTGGLLSAALNAGQIAVASFIAFVAVGGSDTLIYQLLGERSRLLKMNGSNVVSALVDSVVFLTLAFGWPPLWSLVAMQFAAKVVGGFVWSMVFTRQPQPALADR